MGSSHLPPATSTPSPVPLRQQRFRRLRPPRIAFGHLGFSQDYSAVRGGRYLAIRGHHRYPKPRRRITSPPFPWPPFFSGPYHLSPRRLFACPRYDQDPAAASTHRVPAGPRFVQDQDPAVASPHRVSSGPRFAQDQDPPQHRPTAFPLAYAVHLTSPSIRLAALLSATSLFSTTSPNRLPASRKPPWSLALLRVSRPGHPLSPHRPLRASRFRPLKLLVPRRA